MISELHVQEFAGREIEESMPSTFSATLTLTARTFASGQISMMPKLCPWLRSPLRMPSTAVPLMAAGLAHGDPLLETSFMFHRLLNQLCDAEFAVALEVLDGLPRRFLREK